MGVIPENYSPAHNILKLENILSNHSFATSETGHDYY